MEAKFSEYFRCWVLQARSIGKGGAKEVQQLLSSSGLKPTLWLKPLIQNQFLIEEGIQIRNEVKENKMEVHSPLVEPVGYCDQNDRESTLPYQLSCSNQEDTQVISNVSPTYMHWT